MCLSSSLRQRNLRSSYDHGVLTKKRDRDYAVSEIWQHLSKEPKPWKLDEAKCRHCNWTVKIGKKSQVAKDHLLDRKKKKCKVFMNFMKAILPEDCPEFVVEYLSSSTFFKQTKLSQLVTVKMTKLQQADFENKIGTPLFSDW